MKQQFLTSTTNSLGNAPVKDCLGMVTEHVVVGSWFGAGMMATLTDTFGGYSDAYGKRLRDITVKAQNGLISKAKRMGANALIGINLDIDEVSGNNKQMFMITATGTAVVADIPMSEASLGASARAELSHLDLIRLQELREKFRILPFTDNPGSKIEEIAAGYADLISSESRIRSLLSAIEEKVTEIKWKTDPAMALKQPIVSLFLALPSNTLSSQIYLLARTAPDFFNGLAILVAPFPLLDLDEVETLLNTEPKMTREAVRALESYYLNAYTKDDIPRFKAIIDKLGELEKTGKDEGKRWFCENGHKNPKEVAVCPKCRLDIFGTSGLASLIEKLKARVSLLEEHFQTLAD